MSAPGRPVPFAPHGAVDGFVCDSAMAKKMAICGRYGSSCGTPFIKNKYIQQHRQYQMFGPYLFDRPYQPWTMFTSTHTNTNTNTNTNQHHNHNTNKNRNRTKTNAYKPFKLKNTRKNRMY
jgi:hypothetical protein